MFCMSHRPQAIDNRFAITYLILMGIVLSKLSSGPYVSRYNKHSYFVLMIGCFVNDTLIYILKEYIEYSFCFNNVIIMVIWPL